jgi:hypothetical protein
MEGNSHMANYGATEMFVQGELFSHGKAATGLSL